MKLQRNALNLLFQPFVFVAGGGALVAGLVIMLLTGWLGWLSGTHFDGVLDAHIGWGGPLWFALAEGVANWLCMTVPALVAGKLLSKSAFRMIDLAGTQALARWPMLLISLACLPDAVGRFSKRLAETVLKPTPELPALDGDAVVFLMTLVLMLACTVWMVALMYQSFSISCNVRGGKAVGTFVVVLLLAETLSKVVLLQMRPWAS